MNSLSLFSFKCAISGFWLSYMFHICDAWSDWWLCWTYSDGGFNVVEQKRVKEKYINTNVLVISSINGDKNNCWEVDFAWKVIFDLNKHLNGTSCCSLHKTDTEDSK